MKLLLLVSVSVIILFIVYPIAAFAAVIYFPVAFASGDLKIKNGKLCCDCSNAENEQLEGLA